MSTPSMRSLITRGFTSSAVAALALAAGGASVGAQSFPARPPAPTAIAPAQFPPFQQAVLPNGLKLLVVSNPRLPVLSISISFPAGSQYDPDGKSGTAEMVAGLLTKGGGTRNAEAVAAAIEGVGGSISARAGADFLTVNVNVLSDNAPLALQLIADAVMRPTFADKEVELYRTQTLSGLQLSQSDPAAIAARVFARELYGKHPYGRSADPASVKAIARADLVAFQTSRLAPRGALMVLAGDITLARAQQVVAAAFTGWSGMRPAAGALLGVESSRTATEVVLVHRAGSVQSNVVMGNLTWAPADPRSYAATIANKILGGGADSRLFMILREQKGWTYGAQSGLTRQLGTGYFTASTEVRTEATDSSLKELLTQLHRIRSEPIPAKEFDDAKNSLVGRFPLQVQTADAVASQVSTAQLLGLAPDYVQSYRQKLAAVTPVMALAAAKAAFRPDAALVVVVGDGTKLYDKLKAIAPVRIVSPDGVRLQPEDLVVKAVALDLAMDQLVPRSDSFAVYVQGNVFGFLRSRLERAGAGWKYIEDTQLGPIMQQHTEVSFGADLAMTAVTQSGKAQGMDTKIDVSYAVGRAKGSATTPQPTGGTKTIQVDAEMPPGAIDDKLLASLLPAFRWAAGAKFPVALFSSGKGSLTPAMLSVSGEESVTVPAGIILAWKIDLTGSDQPVTFWVEKSAPHRLVKFASVGAPVEMRLVK